MRVETDHADHAYSGDRVGIGYQHSSCGRCKLCVTDHEPYCDQAAVYGFANHDLGTLSTSVLWSARHAYLIPSSIESADAAPLMCGGATVYAVLAKVHPGDTVGIVGVGGLGHLAIQFANKMGCEVIAFSRGESKREDAVKLGASTYVDAGQNVTDQLGGKRVNHLIVTSGQQPEWDTFLPLMAKLGCIHLLTVDMEGRFSVPFMPIIDLGLTISGSILAGSSTYEDMLAFAARHRIKPTIQRFSFDETGIKSAFEAMKDGSLRYRAVVEMNDS